MNKAEELIACLEGEIAKRDETIARLEPQLNRSIQANYDLRAELEAIKAQEPVAHDTKGSRKALGAMNAKLKAKIGRLERELAAPAAKPQVVIPELDREGFEDEYSGEYGTPVSVLRLLRDGENYIEKPQHSDRLNSSWWMWKKARARLYAVPVSEAKAQGLVMPDQDRYFEIVSGVFCIDLGQELAMKLALVTGTIHNEIISLNAATAAPAADAWGVLEQAMYTLISIGYHENSGLVHELRQALAAHRAAPAPGGE